MHRIAYTGSRRASVVRGDISIDPSLGYGRTAPDSRTALDIVRVYPSHDPSPAGGIHPDVFFTGDDLSQLRQASSPPVVTL